MNARAFFEDVRKAGARLRQVERLIANHGEDWRPGNGGGTGPGDPTASRAISRVTATTDLEREREAIVSFQLEATAICAGVSKALGEHYGAVLLLYYVSGMTWAQVSEAMGRSKPWAMQRRDIALDWIDSVGPAHAKAGTGIAEE